MFSRGQNSESAAPGGRSRDNALAMVVLVVLCASPPVQAQTTAVLQGRVVDESGAVVPAAVIRVRDDSIGFAVSVRTDLEGHYHIAGDSRRDVHGHGGGDRISHRGHRGAERRRRPHAGARLSPGRRRTKRDGASSARRCRSSIARRPPSATSSRRQTVQQMPLNGRHFTDLGLLVPGSVAPSQTGFSSRPIRGIGALAFNTAGNREEAVAFLVNGVSTNNLTFGSLIFEPPLGSIQEFKVDNSAFARRARSRVRRDRQSSSRDRAPTSSTATSSSSSATMRSMRATSSSSRRRIRIRSSGTSSADRSAARSGAGGRSSSPSYEGFRQRQGVDLNSVVLSDEQRAAATDPVIRQLIPLIPRANFFDADGTPRFVGSAPAVADQDRWTIDVRHNAGDERSPPRVLRAVSRSARSSRRRRATAFPGSERRRSRSTKRADDQRNAHLRIGAAERSALRPEPPRRRHVSGLAAQSGGLRHPERRHACDRTAADDRRRRAQLRRARARCRRDGSTRRTSSTTRSAARAAGTR